MEQGQKGGKNISFIESTMMSCAIKRTEQYTYKEFGQPNILRYMSLKDSNSDYG